MGKIDPAAEVATFLTSRRAKITPEQVGLHSYGERRVPGLRREEVATLAGVSLEYYKRLERGHLGGVSDGVLEAIAGALRLDEAERAHLFDLVRAAHPSPIRPRRAMPQSVRPGIQTLLDSINSPAIVRNARFDYLAANPLGRALYAPVFESTVGPPNSVRFVFLDPAAEQFYPEWDLVSHETVAALRSEAGRVPYDAGLNELICEISAGSGEFRKLWAAHNVRFHDTGDKHIHHPEVGDLQLTYETMQLAADPSLTVSVFNAEVGSPSAGALAILSSWSAAATTSGTGVVQRDHPGND